MKNSSRRLTVQKKIGSAAIWKKVLILPVYSPLYIPRKVIKEMEMLLPRQAIRRIKQEKSISMERIRIRVTVVRVDCTKFFNIHKIV